MKIVSTFHQPSSVTSSLKCRLSAQSALGHLVVANSNRIEVSAVTAEGLRRECSLEVWGRVLSIKPVPAKDEGVSNILALLDHPHPKLLLLELTSTSTSSALATVWHLDLHDRHARHAEFFTDIVTSAAREIAVVSCYIGKLKVICFSNGRVEKEFDVILPELNLLSLVFIETTVHTHTLAILHIDHMRRIQLLARELDIDELELSITPSPCLQRAILPASSFPDTENPIKLVPVPPFPLDPSTNGDEADAECLGGVLLLGGRKVIFVEAASAEEQRYFKGKDKRQQGRKNSGADSLQRQMAKQKDKEREAKKVKVRAMVKWPWSEVTAWCPADDDMRRFLVGDMYGRLALLTITDSPELILVPIGEISAPTTLSYLSSQVLYVGSHTGDSQLLRIHPSPQGDISHETLPIPSNILTVVSASVAGDPQGPSVHDDDDDVEMELNVDRRPVKGGKIVRLKGTFIEVLDQFRNLAPILDAVMADTDESGQPQIVTCSGEANTGSLNVVRTGADFQELAVLKDIHNVTNIFPIRNRYEEDVDTHILVSTLHESYLLRLEGRDAISYVEPKSTALITDLPTLALANIPRRVSRPCPAGASPASSYADSAYVVQVTSRGVSLVEYDAAIQTFSPIGGGWTPEAIAGAQSREIVAASLNASQFVVALSGGMVVSLNLGLNGQLNVMRAQPFPGKEVSALSCSPLDPTKKFSSYIAVAFWDSNEIGILSLKDEKNYLKQICTSAPLPSLPSSVVLHNFGEGKKSKDNDYRPFVIAGLVDGTVACMSFQDDELKDSKFFPLGTAPLSLSVSEVDGRRAVFASGGRTAVFYWEKQRLRQSPVMLKDVAAGASLNTAHFPSCQILATSSSLHIGQIRGVEKMQIRSIPLGLDNPRRIGYHPGYNMFGVACRKGTPERIGESPAYSSTFNLFDGTTFSRLSRFECEVDEHISALKSLSNSGISTSAAFCIGTVRIHVGEYEPSLGRLLLFEVQGNDLELTAAENTDGCVYAVTAIHGMIAAAVNTSVDLYCVIEEDGATRLKRVHRWNHNYFVTSLVAHSDTLIAGDALSSVSVLKVVGKDLVTVARDFAPVWPFTVEAVRNNGIIGSNTDCNIFTFTLQSMDDRQRLERDGHYHFGEVIVKFLPGGLSVQDTHESHVFDPEHVFFTSSGRIGVVLHVADDIALDLTSLQSNMSAEILGPGDVQHSKWRTPSNARGGSDAEQAIGFLDGDFLEQFLTYPDQDKLLKGKHRAERLKISREKAEDILERLQSLV